MHLLGDDHGMKRTYGVVWREGASPLATGKLELLPRGLRLEGRERSEDIPYERLSSVHIGRTATERINGRPSLVLERTGAAALTIAAVAETGLVGEIAEQLGAFQLGAAPSVDDVEELSFLPTPGPGDSEGGDIF